MGKAALLYENLADAGTVSASSWVAAAPPATLQDKHVSRRWKGRNGDTEWILLDLGSSQEIDTIGLLGVQGIFSGEQQNLGAAAVTRVRVSLADPTGEAGEVYDSGAAAGRIDDAYAALWFLRPAPIAGRYVLVDVSQTSSEAILAGRLIVGLRNPFSINFSYGWSYGYQDNSRKAKSAGGQTFIDLDERFRVLSLSFDMLDKDDRHGFVRAADRRNAMSKDVLFVIDSETTDPGWDCIWGLVTDLSAPTQPHFDLFAKAYAIEERL